MTQFATIDDYYAYQGLAVPTLDEAASLSLNSLLTRASDRIIRITRTARFSVDADGVPTPDSTRDAFRRATSAQAIVMRSGGEEGDAVIGEDFSSVSLIGVQFTRKADTDAAGVVMISGRRYSSEAIDILIGAGLFSTAVNSPR